MRVTTKGVSRLAIEAGVPESTIERNIEALTTLTLLIAKRERKICKQAIRAWYFDKNLSKGPLFNVLNDDDDYDLI